MAHLRRWALVGQLTALSITTALLSCSLLYSFQPICPPAFSKKKTKKTGPQPHQAHERAAAETPAPAAAQDAEPLHDEYQREPTR